MLEWGVLGISCLTILVLLFVFLGDTFGVGFFGRFLLTLPSVVSLVGGVALPIATPPDLALEGLAPERLGGSDHVHGHDAELSQDLLVVDSPKRGVMDDRLGSWNVRCQTPLIVFMSDHGLHD